MQIQNKMNNINNEQKEIKQLLIRKNELQIICNQKDAYYKTKSSQQYEIQKKLNAAKSDNREILVYNQDYFESTVYGTVKKGTVHKRNFSYSGVPILKIVENCKATEKQGSGGYWSSRNKGQNYYNVTYSGPSHQFGSASVKIYCQRKYSNQGLAQIKQYQELNKKEEEWKQMAKNQMHTELQRLRELDKNIHQTSQRVSLQLEAEKQTCQRQIEQLEERIAITQEQITEIKQTIKYQIGHSKTIKEQIRVSKIEVEQLNNDSVNIENQMKSFQNLISEYRKTIEGMTQSQNNFSNINIKSEMLIKNLKGGVITSKEKIEVFNKQIQSEQGNITKQQLDLKQQESNIQTLEEKIKSNNSQIQLSRTKLLEKNEQFQLLKQVNRLLELKASIIVMFLAEYKKKNPLYF